MDKDISRALSLLLQSINTLTECTICHKTIRHIATLSCGHNFCSHCIREYIRVTPRCPKCCQPSSRRDVCQLPMRMALLGRLGSLKQSIEKQLETGVDNVKVVDPDVLQTMVLQLQAQLGLQPDTTTHTNPTISNTRKQARPKPQNTNRDSAIASSHLQQQVSQNMSSTSHQLPPKPPVAQASMAESYSRQQENHCQQRQNVISQDETSHARVDSHRQALDNPNAKPFVLNSASQQLEQPTEFGMDRCETPKIGSIQTIKTKNYFPTVQQQVLQNPRSTPDSGDVDGGQRLQAHGSVCDSLVQQNLTWATGKRSGGRKRFAGESSIADDSALEQAFNNKDSENIEENQAVKDCCRQKSIGFVGEQKCTNDCNKSEDIGLFVGLQVEAEEVVNDENQNQAKNSARNVEQYMVLQPRLPPNVKVVQTPGKTRVDCLEDKVQGKPQQSMHAMHASVLSDPTTAFNSGISTQTGCEKVVALVLDTPRCKQPVAKISNQDNTQASGHVCVDTAKDSMVKPCRMESGSMMYPIDGLQTPVDDTKRPAKSVSLETIPVQDASKRENVERGDLGVPFATSPHVPPLPVPKSKDNQTEGMTRDQQNSAICQGFPGQQQQMGGHVTAQKQPQQQGTYLNQNVGKPPQGDGGCTVVASNKQIKHSPQIEVPDEHGIVINLNSCYPESCKKLDKAKTERGDVQAATCMPILQPPQPSLSQMFYLKVENSQDILLPTFWQQKKPRSARGISKEQLSIESKRSLANLSEKTRQHIVELAFKMANQEDSDANFGIHRTMRNNKKSQATLLQHVQQIISTHKSKMNEQAPWAPFGRIVSSATSPNRGSTCYMLGGPHSSKRQKPNPPAARKSQQTAHFIQQYGRSRGTEVGQQTGRCFLGNGRHVGGKRSMQKPKRKIHKMQRDVALEIRRSLQKIPPFKGGKGHAQQIG